MKICLANTMACTANIQLQLGPQLHSSRYRWPQEKLELDIPAFYSFIDDLKNYPTILTNGILSNLTFWSIKWIEFINEWLISYDKRLVNFINFLERFRENKSVKGFILSSELIKCPWEHCYQKITQQEKENSSRLNYNEFEKILKFLGGINFQFVGIIDKLGINSESDLEKEEN